jgi:hypothetical protein
MEYVSMYISFPGFVSRNTGVKTMIKNSGTGVLYCRQILYSCTLSFNPYPANVENMVSS